MELSIVKKLRLIHNAVRTAFWNNDKTIEEWDNTSFRAFDNMLVINSLFGCTYEEIIIPPNSEHSLKKSGDTMFFKKPDCVDYLVGSHLVPEGRVIPSPTKCRMFYQDTFVNNSDVEQTVTVCWVILKDVLGNILVGRGQGSERWIEYDPFSDEFGVLTSPTPNNNRVSEIEKQEAKSGNVYYRRILFLQQAFKRYKNKNKIRTWVTYCLYTVKELPAEIVAHIMSYVLYRYYLDEAWK